MPMPGDHPVESVWGSVWENSRGTIQKTMNTLPELKREWRITLRRLAQGDTTPAQAHRHMQIQFREYCPSKRTCRRWLKKFRSGVTSLQSKPRTRPDLSEFDNELDRELEETPNLTAVQMARDHGVSPQTVARGLKRLGYSRKLRRKIPHLLTQEQKNQRAAISRSNLLKNQEDPFLDFLITSDETFITKHTLAPPGQYVREGQEPEPALAAPEPDHKKLMLCIWWASWGIVHYEILERDTMVDSELYCQQLERVQEKLLALRPRLVNRREVVYLHDNATPHRALRTQAKIRELGWSLLPHPPYSPDLAPSDYHLFRGLKRFLYAQEFVDHETHIQRARNWLETRPLEFFRSGIHRLPTLWQGVLDANGGYPPQRRPRQQE